jgi:ABC-type branched-subunit amino acid transport system ATPase component/branched-subunit amino acid ABC-type transport system permease component
MLPFIIIGLTTGAVYGLAGVGLVLTYKTSGIFNFSYGALATVAVYVFYELNVVHHVNWILAAAITLVAVGLALGYFFERFGRLLAGTSLVIQVVSTLGVFLLVQSLVLLVFGDTITRYIPPFLGTGLHQIFGVYITDAQIVTFAVAVLATVALYIALKYSRLGISMRAVVDNPELLGVAGTSPVRVRRAAWIIGTVLAAGSGILIAPLQADLNGTNLTLLVLQAFGAAAIGAFASLPLTFVGGIAIGIGEALCSKYFTSGLLSGLAPTLSFVVLFAVLLLFPKRRLAAGVAVKARNLGTWSAPWQIQASGGLVILIFLLFVPSFAGIHLTDWTQALAGVIAFMALGLLTRTSKQVSLCQVAFLAIGACGLSHLALDHHVPWGIAVILSGLIAVPIAAVLAIPATRLSGLYLALATFGFGVLLAYMFYPEPFMFTSNAAGLTVPRPRLSWLNLTSDKAYYYLVLVLTLIAILGVIALTRSRLGRLLAALADSPTALATGGTSTLTSQVLVFCISGFLAAVAGALGAAAQTNVNGDAYSPLLSLTFLALVMISVGREPWYALLAAFGVYIIPSYVTASGNITNYLTLLFGIGAMFLAYTTQANQKQQRRAAALLDPIFRRRTAVPARPQLAGPAHPPVPETRLGIKDLKVAFGGLVAVDGVSLAAPTGRITGLIGPNGAGKTTTFNACSGLNRASAGAVLLGDKDISRLGPAARARRGIGRTFQQMELFDSLTVRQNVQMGLESGAAGASVLRQVFAGRSEMKRIAAAAIEAMTLCGITELADKPAADLSTGQRRLVELARCLASDSSILLLDEPSAGLDKAETAAFGEILRRVVTDRGIGVLLVEHDMSLVMTTCDWLYLLDFGHLIFEGEPSDAQNSAVVRAAYLGDSANEKILEAEEQKQEDLI